jgi:hypothetical protein
MRCSPKRQTAVSMVIRVSNPFHENHYPLLPYRHSRSSPPPQRQSGHPARPKRGPRRLLQRPRYMALGRSQRLLLSPSRLLPLPGQSRAVREALSEWMVGKPAFAFSQSRASDFFQRRRIRGKRTYSEGISCHLPMKSFLEQQMKNCLGERFGGNPLVEANVRFYCLWRPASGHRSGWRVVRGLSPLEQSLSPCGRPRIFKSMEKAQAHADRLNALDSSVNPV